MTIIFLHDKRESKVICRNILLLLLMTSLGSCFLFEIDQIKETYQYQVLIQNGTRDTNFFQICYDTTEIDINDFFKNYKLLPDSTVSISDVSSEDMSYNPIQYYLENYNREGYIVHNGETILKKWFIREGEIGHSPYNKESWGINRTTDPDIRGYIKFTIEEADLGSQ
ncbi:hypothetical protein [Marinifilum caeruleilacunae]|uniref:Lipoprotein n=1 Tax=Marinifilum caeruleilacunae TaxID=2499076 RepID=A0ABX1WRY2_9BACT|nr:hypothetical protein [Marinifilum caeruleilacunae]NOU58833.1 hypothetical protein [Marinifilum caeruleilacunae]